MFKRLFGAVVDGVGLTAGKALFDQAVEHAKEELREPTEEERLAQEAKAQAALVAETKRQKAESERIARERASAAAKRETEIDDELATLKRKLRKS